MQLVGRARERQEIATVLRSGAGTALVRGPAGIGKTTVAEAVVADLRADGWRVETTVAAVAGASTPFGPFLHLRDPGLVPPQSTGEQLVRLVAELGVRATGRQLAVFVDDAHLLDPASVLLVQHLASHRAAAILLAARAPEPLAEDLVTLVREGRAIATDLGPLAREDCDALVDQLLGGPATPDVAGEIWRVSAGNPLFARELVSEGRERGALTRREDGLWLQDGPLGGSTVLWDVIETRLGGLDQPARELLDALAVAGPLRLNVVEELLSLGDLEAVEATALIRIELRADDRIVDFGHPLYGEILRQHAPAARLQRARRRVADALSGERDARPEHLLLEARLRLDAGDDDPELYLAAAHRAVEWFDAPFAVRCAEAASRGATSVEADVVRATALGMAGRDDEAVALFESLGRGTREPEQQSAILFQHAQYLLYQRGRVEDAIAVLRDRLGELPEPATVPLRSFLSWVLFLGGRLREARDIGADLLADQSVPVVLGGGPAYASAQLLLGHPDDAYGVAERAFAELQTLDIDSGVDLTLLALNFMWLRILAFWQLGRAREADNPFAPYRAAIAARLQSVPIAGYGMPATQAYVRGHVDECVETYGELGIQLRTAPLPVSIHNAGMLATAHAWRGDAARAKSELAFIDEVVVPELAIYRWWIERARAWTWASAGDVERALDHCLSLAESYSAEDFHLTTSLHDVVRLGGAVLVTERLGEQAGRDGASWLDRVCADHASAAVEDDGDALLEVATRFQEGGLDLHACEAAAQSARALGDAGDSVGAARAVARVDALIDVCGQVRTPALATVPRTLTHREHQVARLAAAGCSNGEIATRLGTSPRTVGNQLQRVYEKLGVRSRAELGPLLDGAPLN